MTQQEHFSLLYQREHKRLDRYVQAVVKDRTEAADLIAEATYIAWEKFDDLRDPDRFAAFLFGIASRLIRKKFRQQKRWKWLGVDHLQQYREPRPDPFMQTEIKQALESLEKLPEAQKEALLLFELSGFSIREIAALQQCTESAVKSRLSRGRDTLKQWLLDSPNIQNLKPNESKS